MTIEEIQKNVTNARFNKLLEEVKTLVDKVAPVLEQLIPLELEDQDIKDRYTRFKVEPEWITDMTEEIMKDKYKDIFYGFFKQSEDNSSGV